MTEIKQTTPVPIMYRVKWEIDVEAANPREAAKKAQATQRNWSSDANVFDVYQRAEGRDPYDPMVPAKRIDLSISEYEESKEILRQAYAHHMNGLLRDRETRQQLLQSGFTGLSGMGPSALVDYIREHNLDKDNDEVRQALEIVA